MVGRFLWLRARSIRTTNRFEPKHDIGLCTLTEQVQGEDILTVDDSAPTTGRTHFWLATDSRARSHGKLTRRCVSFKHEWLVLTAIRFVSEPKAELHVVATLAGPFCSNETARCVWRASFMVPPVRCVRARLKPLFLLLTHRLSSD